MRRIYAGSALLVGCTFATAASAQDAAATGVYVQAEAGYAFSGDTGFTPPFPSSDDAIVKLTDGYEIAGALGYDFGGFRLEAEIAHRDISLDGAIGSQGNPYGFAGYEFVSEGQIETTSYMLNAVGDFAVGENFELFAGAGIGKSDSDIYVLNYFEGTHFDAPYFDSTDSSFAWQAMAGARFNLSDAASIHAKYRFHQVTDAAFPDFSDSDYTGSFDSHSIVAGVGFRF